MQLSAANKLKCANAVCSICKADSTNELDLDTVRRKRSEYESKLKKAEAQGGSEFQKLDKIKMKLKYLTAAQEIMERNGGELYTFDEKKAEYTKYILSRHPDSVGGSAEAYEEAIQKRNRVITDSDLKVLESVCMENSSTTAANLDPLTGYLDSINRETSFDAEEINFEVLSDIRNRQGDDTLKGHLDAISATKRFYQQLAGTHEHSGKIQRKRDMIDSWETVVKALSKDGTSDAAFRDILMLAEWPELMEIIPAGKDRAAADEFDACVSEARLSGIDEPEKLVKLGFRLYGIQIDSTPGNSAPPQDDAMKEQLEKKFANDAAVSIQQALNMAEEELDQLEKLLDNSHTGLDDKSAALENAYKRTKRSLRMAEDVMDGMPVPDYMDGLYDMLMERFNNLTGTPVAIGRNVEASISDAMSGYEEALPHLLELQDYNNALEDMSIWDIEGKYSDIRQHHESIAPFMDKASNTIKEAYAIKVPFICSSKTRKGYNSLVQAASLYENVTARHNDFKNILINREELEAPGEAFIFLELIFWACIFAMGSKLNASASFPASVPKMAAVFGIQLIIAFLSGAQESWYGRMCNIRIALLAFLCGTGAGLFLHAMLSGIPLTDIGIQAIYNAGISGIIFITGLAAGRKLGVKIRNDRILQKDAYLHLPAYENAKRLRLSTRNQKNIARAVSVIGCMAVIILSVAAILPKTLLF